MTSSRAKSSKMDAFIQYGIVVGVQEAMADSGLEALEENATCIGAAIGSALAWSRLDRRNHSSPGQRRTA